MFKAFADSVHAQFESMRPHELFTVDVEDIFASYLAAFPEGTNPMFRERTEHDCNCCKQFIRRLGRVVAIVNGEVITVWDDYANLPHPYEVVGATMAALVRQAPIMSVFRTKETHFGAQKNFDNHDDNLTWHHFHGVVPMRSAHQTMDPAEKIGKKRAVYDVFKRGLNELKETCLLYTSPSPRD